ncbi:MAG: ankyrin repeat domain-containing protein, partial [Verrucomicrobia bacterium]|nr:ankyrin repeat domain-containing protein [Verrucomicrobiota bacterium]
QPQFQLGPADISHEIPGQLDVNGTLHKVLDILSLPSHERKKEIANATALVDNLLYTIKATSNSVGKPELELLKRCKSAAGKNSRCFKSLIVLQFHISKNLTQIHAISTEEIATMNSKQFLSHISELFKEKPELTGVVIQGQGYFSRNQLELLVDLDASRDPRTLRDFFTKLKHRFCWSDLHETYPLLHLHVIAGRSDLVAADLKNGSVNECDKTGLSALHWACYFGDQDVVTELIANGADINQLDKDGNTPLLRAIYDGNMEMLELLLKNGADVNLPNTKRSTPLSIAVKHENSALIETLLRYGADMNLPDLDGNTPLLFAIAKNNVTMAELLLENGANIDMPNNNFHTPLSLAVFLSNMELIELLLKHGADTGLPDKFGRTPLIAAVCKMNIEVAKLLLENGSDVNLQDHQGATALLFAVAVRNTQLVELLLRFSADVTITDMQGETVLANLKFRKPQTKKKITQLIQYYTTTDLFTRAVTYAKLAKQTKLLSHSYALQGTSTIQGQRLNLEGTYYELPLRAIAKSIQRFSKQFPALLDKSHARHFAQGLLFAHDMRSHTPKEALARIRRGLPTTIATGFTNHAVAVLIWNDLFIHCDRAGVFTKALSVYRFNRDKIAEQDIELLIGCKDQSCERYVQAFQETLPTRLEFSQSDNEVMLEKMMALPMQTVGNCAWASVEGIVKAYLLVNSLRDTAFVLPETQGEQNGCKLALEHTFTSWLIFQRLELLERYLDNPVDHALIQSCFISLWSTKIDNPELIARLKLVEDKYCHVANSKQFLTHRINKVKHSILPALGIWPASMV